MSSDARTAPVAIPPARPEPARAIGRIDQLVGNTPMVGLRTLGREGAARIYVKMESLNPGGSMRDRYIYEIVEHAFDAGQLVRGDTVALAGLDDSAVSAALIGNVLGLRTRIFAPATSSRRLLDLLERYGADVIWTDAQGGLEQAVAEAATWSRQSPDRMYLDGYRREAVRHAYAAIAAEIIGALDGRRLGAFVTSVTTGATFRHVARELRQTYPDLHVGGASLLEGELPDVATHQFNYLARITMAQAWQMRDRIAREQGLLLGPKGAACVSLALELQAQVPAEEVIVALNPDSGQRHLGWERDPVVDPRNLPQPHLRPTN